MSADSSFRNLRYVIDNYVSDYLFIRLMGSMGGDVKFSESIENKILDFNSDNLFNLFIDSRKIFSFTEKFDVKGFSVEYLEEKPFGFLMPITYDKNPFDSILESCTHTNFRAVLDYHLLEITFKGRVRLEFDRWWYEPNFAFWNVSKI